MGQNARAACQYWLINLRLTAVETFEDVRYELLKLHVQAIQDRAIHRIKQSAEGDLKKEIHFIAVLQTE